MIDFAAQPLLLLAAIFAGAALAVWVAGGRLTALADEISDRLHLGKAFTGMLLLGGVTSLPEIMTVGTASIAGNPSLAVNNLLGSAGINVLLLALADFMIGRDALTSTVARPAVLLQGSLDILLLAVTAAAIVGGEMMLFGVGAWSSGIFALVLVALWASSRYGKREPWRAQGGRVPTRRLADGRDFSDASVAMLLARFGLVVVVIAGAGYVLAATGDAIAAKSGLGSNIVGLALVGAATSLPEISTIRAALRLRRYEMAIGDIFGTNMFNLALIFLADLLYDGGPVLREMGSFEVFAALLAIVMTTLYLMGLLERRDKTFARMGYDSALVILTYGGGLAILWRLSVA